MNKRIAAALALALAVSPANAIDKGKAKYIGGTLDVQEKAEGPIDLKDTEKLVFSPKKGTPAEIAWASVEEVEYGQKAGRRIKTAIFLSPLALFGKSRKHYVTLSFKDGDGADQAAVFEFDKNDIRQTLAVIKARTGKEITMQDEEAAKQMGGDKK